MRKKYIIEIPEDKITDFVGSTHFLMPYMMAGHIGHHDTGLPIEPYIEPDLEQVRKEAYDKGFEDGKELCPDPKICYNNAYQNGLSDAWEAARKIDKMTATEFHDCFLEGYDMGILYKYTASEAIAKIKAWEDSKQEIKVGDEVDAPFGKAAVFDVKDDAISYLYATGETGWEKPEYVKEHKTGRNFPEIAAVFEKMKKE